MKPAKAIGILSILAGITACICTINVVAAFLVAPVGIISGGIAAYKGQKLLGRIGIGLSVLAPIVTIFLLWYWGWFSRSSFGD